MSDHDSCQHDLYQCTDEGFARPNTSRVRYDMADAIVDAAIDVDTARRAVYHLTEEEDAYRVVSEHRGRYVCLVNIANSPSGMGPEELTGVNAWATVVYDAINAARLQGISEEEIMGEVRRWQEERFPHDDPIHAGGAA